MTTNPQFDSVAEFNNTFGHAVRDVPSLDAPDLPLRMGIHLEETGELVTNFLYYLSTMVNLSDTQEDTDKFADLTEDTATRIYDFAHELLFTAWVVKKNLSRSTYEISDEVRNEHIRDAFHHMLEVLDGGGDSLVTLFGFMQGAGLPITEGFDIIHESNMSKAGPDGKPVYFTEGPKKGKIAKGPGYFPPTAKLRELLESKMEDQDGPRE